MNGLREVISSLKENGVRWVHTTFVDIRGLMHDVVIPAKRFTEGTAFDTGIGFDGSSVRGFKSIVESDMVLTPDPETLKVIPWIADEKQKSAIILGDVHEAFGGKEPSEVCPRGYVAKRAAERAKKMGVDLRLIDLQKQIYGWDIGKYKIKDKFDSNIAFLEKKEKV